MKKANEQKLSCKGTNKNQNKITWDNYMKAFNGEIENIKNRGFRIDNGAVKMYEVEKIGFSNYYDKRRVLDDMIHTEPLF